MKIIRHNRNLLVEPGFHWLHSGNGGSAVLKTDVSWRNIAGIIIATESSVTFVYFRRSPR